MSRAALTHRLRKLEDKRPTLPILILRQCLDRPGYWTTGSDTWPASVPQPPAQVFHDDDIEDLAQRFQLICMEYVDQWRNEPT